MTGAHCPKSLHLDLAARSPSANPSRSPPATPVGKCTGGVHPTWGSPHTRACEDGGGSPRARACEGDTTVTKVTERATTRPPLELSTLPLPPCHAPASSLLKLRNKESAGSCAKLDENDHPPTSPNHYLPYPRTIARRSPCLPPLQCPSFATFVMLHPYPVWKLLRGAVPERGLLDPGPTVGRRCIGGTSWSPRQHN